MEGSLGLEGEGNPGILLNNCWWTVNLNAACSMVTMVGKIVGILAGFVAVLKILESHGILLFYFLLKKVMKFYLSALKKTSNEICMCMV